MNLVVPGLHDIHLPPSPGWWPPAPGWWLLAAAMMAALAWTTWRILRERRRTRRLAVAMREFDTAVAAARDAPARLAAASTLLRRAVLVRHPSAASLDGKAWLQFLDGEDPARAFSQGPGGLLVDGAFRRTLDADIAPALTLARARFASLLAGDLGGRDHA
ncbi:MAG TPA: DUF4381 domain-containing protein [Xanthomonadaceae bacterium]|jgi:hypothetical protein